jgi:aryl-phospho-beta-D-glucosidase BglC (GH1 family)
MKHYIILFTILLFTIIFNAQTSPHDMVEKMGRGINLGNVLSAPAEGDWSPAATEQYFIDVAAAGFTNVRIPIDFFGTRTTDSNGIASTAGYSPSTGSASNYTDNPETFTIDATYLTRIETVIDWSLNQGLVTILDFHGSNLKSDFIKTFKVGQTVYTHPDSERRAADNDKFRAIWSQVADRFKNKSEDLLFEIINEPYFYMSKADMDTLNADILAIIRGSGGSNGTRNVIITGGTGTSHEAPLQIDPNIISGDSYLIATFHYYQPFDFTSSSADSRDEESWGTEVEKGILTGEFDQVLTFSNLHNIPVFLGEFGADNTGGYKYSTGDLNTISNNATGFADGGPDNASRVEYHRYVAEQAINRGFSFAAWDSGPKSNKTIHMRKDSPSAVNFNISAFSVNTYEPKSTNISTVEDTSTWVEDVKNAILAIGTAESGDWNAADTWVGGLIPTSSDDVIINTDHIIIIKSAVGVNKLTINAGGGLTINSGKSIDITNDLTNNGSESNIIFFAGASGPAALKIGGTYTGPNVTFNHRMIADFNDKWVLIAAPLKEATINNYINGAQTIVLNEAEDKQSLGTYNDANTAILKYTYVTNPQPNTTDQFGVGQGYATKLNNTETPAQPKLQFKGKLQDAATVDFPISDLGDGFNLVGNPYSTWLFANLPANANNLLTTNTAILSEATIWLWDTLNETFIPKNQDDVAFRIAPTQGFFVKAIIGGGNFSFAKEMQTLTADTYYKTSDTRFEINLVIAANTGQRNTTVRYINNSTTSFDNGSDSSLFGGDGDALSIYTELVENNTGKKLAIQSLPNSDYENMVIAVGISADARKEIIFSAETLNLPTGLKVFLEDRNNNVFTCLDEANAIYKVTVDAANTDGRFYLHTKTSSLLSLDTDLLNSVNIYNTSTSNLKITGLQKGETTMSLFNLLGKQIMTTSFDGANVNNISLPRLATGIYVVKLQTKTGEVNKKIILE